MFNTRYDVANSAVEFLRTHLVLLGLVWLAEQLALELLELARCVASARALARESGVVNGSTAVVRCCAVVTLSRLSSAAVQ